MELVSKFDALQYEFKLQSDAITGRSLFVYLEDKLIVTLNRFVVPEFELRAIYKSALPLADRASFL